MIENLILHDSSKFEKIPDAVKFDYSHLLFTG